MDRTGWASSTDVVIAAALAAVLGLGLRLVVLIIPSSALDFSGAIVSIATFAIPVAFYWVIGRCWWLIRKDDGHVGVMTAGVVVIALGGISNLAIAPWSPSSVVSEFEFFIYFGANGLGAALVAIALARWSRTPQWFTWIAYLYLAVLALGVARMLLPLSPVIDTVSGFAYSMFLAALALALYLEVPQGDGSTAGAAH